MPDELFWANARSCAARGFFIFLIASQVIVVITLLLAASGNLNRYALPFAVGGDPNDGSEHVSLRRDFRLPRSK